MPPKKPAPMTSHSGHSNDVKVLFILKAQGLYGTSQPTCASGLRNSAVFVVDMLVDNGIDAVLEIVNDNNDIDRVVTLHAPTHVIIEALWVVPSKFDVLTALHPDVQWIVRSHSEIPFLAQEGIAMEWLLEYPRIEGVKIAFNSSRTTRDFRQLLIDTDPWSWGKNEAREDVIYLPNFYPVEDRSPNRNPRPRTIIDVGAFGAIRPLKNQLTQAVAAIRYARKNGLALNYHINASRVEQKGEAQLKNIRKLFEALDSSRFQLIEHAWLDRPDFLDLVRQMDIGLQMSFTESFNIVVADFVSNGIPVVTSPEIRWVDSTVQADPTDIEDIVAKMERAFTQHRFAWLVDWNLRGLIDYCNTSRKTWLQYFR